MNIQNDKKVWVAWTNTDTTEGRGQIIPQAVCVCEATARRMGHMGGVQGCDCDVTEETAFQIHGKWYAPARIFTSTPADDLAQARINAREAAKAKALAAGLTIEDINDLK